MDDESGKITLLKTLQNLTWEPDNEANNIKNLITLPVKVTDGYDCGHRDHTARNKEYKDNWSLLFLESLLYLQLKTYPLYLESTNSATLKLKVFTNFEPKFQDPNEKTIEFDETAPEAELPNANLPEAIDDNNVNPPPDDNWVDQTVCYYMINASADAR